MTIKVSKYICCTVDVTIATRMIAFIGIVISFILMTVLCNDKVNRNDNYDISRKTALALGLDWSHFHENTSSHPDNDPEGSMIQIVMIFYSLSFLILNLVLFFGTIKLNWLCSIPWLVCEPLGCLSKLGALLYYIRCAPDHMTRLSVTGCAVYIGITLWWWFVVFAAQRQWRHTIIKECAVELASVSFELKTTSPL